MVMMAALENDTSPVNSNGIKHSDERLYGEVELSQKEYGWQTSGTLLVSGTNSNDGHHWVGTPSPMGICMVSYS